MQPRLTIWHPGRFVVSPNVWTPQFHSWLLICIERLAPSHLKYLVQKAEAPTNGKTDLLTSLKEGIYGIYDDTGQNGRFTRFRL